MNPAGGPSLRSLYQHLASVFDPASADARRLAWLGWVMIVLAAAVFLFVIGTVGFAIVRRRRAPLDDGDAAPAVSERGWVMGGGLLMPAVVLFGVFFASVVALAGATHGGTPAVDITVIGHQWWWEVRYAADSIVTANEVHVPVGKAVRLELRSADVIHSFWVPRLAGKTDVIPGQVNSAWLEASDTGVYRGPCAEYCGTQHARMALTVVAESPSRYAAWVTRERAGAAVPTDTAAEAGRAVFLRSACGYCHTVRGAPAGGGVGPDLTHVGSRLTLAAGTLVNTPANLRLWIAHSQVVKPGTTMPRITLGDPDLDQLVRYLEGLR